MQRANWVLHIGAQVHVLLSQEGINIWITLTHKDTIGLMLDILYLQYDQKKQFLKYCPQIVINVLLLLFTHWWSLWFPALRVSINQLIQNVCRKS